MAKSGIVHASSGGDTAFAPLFPANLLVAMIGALVPQIFALSSIKKTILVIFGATRKIWVWDDDNGAVQGSIADIIDLNAMFEQKIMVSAEDVPTVSKVFHPNPGSWNVSSGPGYPVLQEPMKSLLEQITKPLPRTFTAAGLLTTIENANQAIVGKSFVALISQHTTEVKVGLVSDNQSDFSDMAGTPGEFFGVDAPLGCLQIESEAIVVPTTREFWEAGATINE